MFGQFQFENGVAAALQRARFGGVDVELDRFDHFQVSAADFAERMGDQVWIAPECVMQGFVRWAWHVRDFTESSVAVTLLWVIVMVLVM
ncbi:hypothetical protein GCM10010439_09530 [Actinocorallia aurantiaca]|uniref:Uncharacterized protein n=1 Tax=Actinocorallia aurantiaca TaxID=46204 RepID=A0ABN3TXE4_9ACTN